MTAPDKLRIPLGDRPLDLTGFDRARMLLNSLAEDLKQLLALYWEDHKKSWVLTSDGQYKKLKVKDEGLDIQHELIKQYEG